MGREPVEIEDTSDLPEREGVGSRREYETSGLVAVFDDGERPVNDESEYETTTESQPTRERDDDEGRKKERSRDRKLTEQQLE